MKKAQEDRSNAVKNLSSSKTEIEKLNKLNQSLLSKNESLQTSLAQARKDYDSNFRAQKQLSSDSSAQTLRLNRALEEIEKYKTLLAKSKEESRQKNASTKKTISELQVDLQRLEKQKADVVLAFKKQQHLIEVLKKQKVISSFT